jgi:hypothetical protein
MMLKDKNRLSNMIPDIPAMAICPDEEILMYKPVIPSHLSYLQFFLDVHGH